MSRLRWFLSAATLRLGWTGLAGVGLIGASLLFSAATLAPLQERENALRAQMALPRATAAAVARRERVSDPAAEMDAFYRSLPREAELTDQLAKLHALGDRHGLALQQAEYRPGERGPDIGQYRIAVPATATYPQLKKFLAAVIAEMPNLALEQLAVQRRAVGESALEVQMQFTLYLRQRT